MQSADEKRIVSNVFRDFYRILKCFSVGCLKALSAATDSTWGRSKSVFAFLWCAGSCDPAASLQKSWPKVLFC